jgi:hypothetical protein
MAGLVPAIHFPEAVYSCTASGKWMAATMGGHDGWGIEDVNFVVSEIA